MTKGDENTEDCVQFGTEKAKNKDRKGGWAFRRGDVRRSTDVTKGDARRTTEVTRGSMT